MLVDGDMALRVRPFERLYAPVVAGWLSDPRELFWVAPSTPAPLTAANVAQWSRPIDRPLLMFADGRPLPCGYAELNPFCGSPDSVWIGHLVIDPAERDGGRGAAFVRALTDLAFDELKAQRVCLVVFPENRAALRCYQGCGFGVVSQEYHSFGDSPQRWRMLRLEFTAPAMRRAASGSIAQTSPAFARNLLES